MRNAMDKIYSKKIENRKLHQILKFQENQRAYQSRRILTLLFNGNRVKLYCRIRTNGKNSRNVKFQLVVTVDMKTSFNNA